MAYSVWQSFITDGGEQVVPSATITVFLEDSGAPATIYSTPTGGPLGNTTTSGTDGLARFFAAGGTYKIVATKGAFTKEFRHVQLGDSQSRDVLGTGRVISESELETYLQFNGQWLLEETGGDPITESALTALAPMPPLPGVSSPTLPFPIVAGDWYSQYGAVGTLNGIYLALTSAAAVALQSEALSGDITASATDELYYRADFETDATASPSAGIHLSAVALTSRAVISGDDMQMTLQATLRNTSAGGGVCQLVLSGDEREVGSLSPVQEFEVVTTVTLPESDIQSVELFINRDDGTVWYSINEGTKTKAENAGPSDFIVAADYENFVRTITGYSAGLVGAGAVGTIISARQSIDKAEASTPAGLTDWLSAVMVYPPPGVSAGSVYEISNPDGLSYLGYTPIDGDKATFGSDLVNVGWSVRQPNAYTDDVINGEAILWAAFAALDPDDYLAGKRFRITDQGGVIVQHDGTQFVQQSPRLPKMTYANLPAADAKWQGWRLRVTDYGGVDVAYTGAAWQATGRFCLSSSGSITHTGDTTETPLVVPSVPHSLLGLGATIDYFLRRGATTSNSTLRVRPTPTVSDITGTAVTELAATNGQIFDKAINYNGADSLNGSGSAAGLGRTLNTAGGVTVSGSFAGQIIYMPVTCQLTDSANTFTLAQCTFWCNPGPFVEV